MRWPTINLRLAAVRRVAYEAADAGLLSPELAAGIRRVKGVRRLGVRMGNWLTAEQGSASSPSRRTRDPYSRAQSSVRLRIAKTTGNSFCREGHPLDAADLVAIRAFIDEDAPHYAAVVLSRLLAATERLAVFPE